VAGVKRSKYCFELGYHAFGEHMRNRSETDTKLGGDVFFLVV